MQNQDHQLFQQAMQDVVPLKQDNTADLSAKTSTPTAAQLARREAAVQEEMNDPNFLSTEYVELLDPHDPVAFKREGVQHGVYRKLRLGKYAIEARLDLHRKSVRQARREVFDFIHECMRLDLRSVMIVHGKGRDIKSHAAVLKSYVAKWLPELPQVMAFHSAQRQHGGLGAVYVMLGKSEKARQENWERHQKRSR